jgi:hypothetical protein
VFKLIHIPIIVISVSDFIHLPYTRDLTEGGIAVALRSLPSIYNRAGGSSYDRLRRIVAGAAAELAFRRYLAECNIPFDVKSSRPFAEPDRYDVTLGGRRCDIKSFLISYRDQISEMKRNPGVVLGAPALVPSDQNAADGHSDNDIYLFVFLSGLVAASQEDLGKVSVAKQPYHLIHVLPDVWIRPPQWTPLGALALKSESDEMQIVEVNGQDEGREMRSMVVELPPRTRIQIDGGFFSLSHIHIKTVPNARIGIHNLRLNQTHVIGALDWANVWVYGMDILLAGYLTRAEFNQHAKPIHPGTRVFQYEKTRTKNLAVAVSELKALSGLFEYAKTRGGGS